MSTQKRLIRVSMAGLTLALFTWGTGTGQDISGSAQIGGDVQAMTRASVHEAFAQPTNLDPVEGKIVSKRPPDPIEELPPEFKPEGDNVIWIPGYWDWDEEQDDFIWISGLWRDTPPGRRWVPGYWAEVDAGFRWHSGMWARADRGQLSYQPSPPRSQERGPNRGAPSDDHFWVPGCWEYHDGDYRWRPGYWAPHQAGWVWVPAQYHRARHGYVYCDGYWDHRASHRGQLFAPVFFRTDASARARFTPSVALRAGSHLLLSLFVNPSRQHYAFGDYYGDTYAKAGYLPWYEYHLDRRGYDPLFTYSRWHYGHENVDYLARLRGWTRYFTNNPDLRPPHTFAEQVAFAARNEGAANVAVSLLGTALNDLVQGASGRNFVRLSADQRTSIAASANQLANLAGQRLNVESTVGAATDAAVRLPQQSLDLPDLPAVDTPSVGRGVPENPIDLRNVTPQLPSGVPSVPSGPVIPNLPF